MATGLEGVFGKASAAKEVILSVKPKLTLATDRTSIATVMTSLKGSDIASDKGSETLERITAASANLDTDLLREQQGQAVRILSEGWSAFLRKLGVSVHRDSALPIREKRTSCLETQGPEEMPDTKAKWKQNIGVLKLAYAVSKEFTCYLSLVEPRAPRDPGATLLKELQKAHNDVQQKISTVTVTEKVQIFDNKVCKAPPTYDGSVEKWRSCSLKMRSYIGGLSTKLHKMVKIVQGYPTKIDSHDLSLIHI